MVSNMKKEEKSASKEPSLDDGSLLQTILDAIPDVIGIQDPDHKIIRYNDAGYKLLGMTQDEVYGKECFSLIGRDRPCEKCATTETYDTKEPSRVERYEAALGIWLDVRAYPILDDKGGLKYVIEHLRDITREKRAEEALVESERKFKNLVEATSDWIWEIDETGHYTYSSPKVEDLIGYSPQEIIGKSPLDLMDASSREKVSVAIQNLLKDPQSFQRLENTNILKNGSSVILETSGVPIYDDNKNFKGYRGIDRNVTERKNAEKEIEFRLRLENVLSSISTDFITTPIDRINDGIISALEKIGELVDADRTYIFLYKDKGRMMDNTHEWVRKGVSPVIDKLKNLRTRDYYMVNGIIEMNGPMVIDSIKDLPSEAEVDMRDLQKEGVKSLVLMPLHLEDKDVGFIGCDSLSKEMKWSTDTVSFLKIVGEIIISAMIRKNAQEDIIQERNRAELYLDLLGHDIGNLHQGIFTSLQLANMKKDMGADPFDVLQRAEEVTKRSMNLVRTVLLLSRLRSRDPKLVPTDICSSIRQSLDTVQKIFPQRKIKVEAELDHPCTPIMAESLISELFFNILHNGIKFQEGKNVKLEIEVYEDEEKVEVHFCDHGPGIPDEMKGSMFQRFQAVGSRSHTGLGLSLVKTLVERYNGKIWISDRVEGDPTKGARFVVSFPTVKELNNLRASYSSISSLLS